MSASFRYSALALVAIASVLLYGFMARAVPTLWPVFGLVSAAIMLWFTIKGVEAAGGASYYYRRSHFFGMFARGLVVVAALGLFVLVGAWLNTPSPSSVWDSLEF
jgi:hypothetical protein